MGGKRRSGQNRRAFSLTKSDPGRIKARVQNTCKSLLRKVNGDLGKITPEMIQKMAEKEGITVVQITKRLNTFNRKKSV